MGGLVLDSLRNKTHSERAAIKAAAHVARSVNAHFWDGDLEIEFSKPSKFMETGIEVYARVWKNGQEVPLGDLNPIRIVNPPILVPTGTKSDVELALGSGTKVAKIDNFKEDVSAALRSIVVTHLRTVLPK